MSRDAALLFALLALSGCGGGGDGEMPPAVSTAPPAPPQQVLAACPAGIDVGDIVPSTAVAPACDSTNFDTHTDIAYAAHGSALLDMLVPRNAAAPRPVVIWIHGGGWQSGDKADRAQAQRLVCRGYALASLNYRLTDTAIFPAQIHDVKAAIRFLRANSAVYGLDPMRFAAFGSSAGGHLAALAGTSADTAILEDLASGNPLVSSRVQAVVDWFGPTRLSDMDAQLLAQGCPAGSASHGAENSPESRLLGCTLSSGDCADEARRADPSQYADSSDPPHLLLHGSDDCVSPAGQSDLLAQSLTASGSCAVFRRVQGAGHGGPAWTSPEVQEATAAFLDRVFARPVAAGISVNCNAFALTGNAAASGGARWTYHSTDDGTEYDLSGVLYAPAGAGPFAGVVVSHGAGGNATGYSSNVARTMREWGLVAIATNYTHAPDAVDEGSLPQGGDGASEANVRRAHKARDLLSCVSGVDMTRLAAHGHSMGAFVTGQLLGSYPGDFLAASHSAGGANDTGPNATRAQVAAGIRTPYQLHHGDADTVVRIELDQALRAILDANAIPNELHVYPGFTHEQMALDDTMFARVRDWYRTHGVL
jgi:acetyl esterase/lipase/predicted alpha/beta-hydrolase family hydrolase